ncbi:tyrosine-type recombinase/integrase [candidate division KSB1 bacterium]|nr:tyrosine-type recombinase/integrase [candidate division KSB1 bacterium]
MAVSSVGAPNYTDLIATGNLVQAFLAGRKSTTLAAYRRDIEDFAAFTNMRSAEMAAQALIELPHGEANAIVLAYRANLIARSLQPATVNRRLAALRSLVKLARTLGRVNWTLEIEGVKGQAYRDTRGPGRVGVSNLFAAATGRGDPKGIRDVAIVRLLYDLGLRRGEVVSLNVEHLNLKEGTLAVLGKSRSARETLTLPESTQRALRNWIEVRSYLRQAGHLPLFVNMDRARKGGRLTGYSIARIVAALGAAVGLKVNPHGLRHAAITEALDLMHGDVRSVQRFSRHKDIRTLTVYDDNRRDMGGEVAKLVAASID